MAQCKCDWYRWGGVCGSCEMHKRLSTLAANLRIAAALCRAFQDGIGTGVDITCDPYNHERYWTPGCGRCAVIGREG